MVKAVIIDDEPNSRELLQNMLQNYCKDVEVVGEGLDVESGIDVIRDLQPELVFLDIEMPGGDGFKILDAFTDAEVNFKVIFVTGYDQYAIKAIRYAALDFLLKPLNLSELQTAIIRARELVYEQRENFRFLHYQMTQRESSIRKLMLPTYQGYALVDINTITRVEAEGNFVSFWFEDGQRETASQSLSHYEELLPKPQFFRIHKSHIVNCLKVVRIDDGRTGMAHMEDGHQLNIAARRKKAFLENYKLVWEQESDTLKG